MAFLVPGGEVRCSYFDRERIITERYAFRSKRYTEREVFPMTWSGLM